MGDRQSAGSISCHLHFTARVPGISCGPHERGHVDHAGRFDLRTGPTVRYPPPIHRAPGLANTAPSWRRAGLPRHFTHHGRGRLAHQHPATTTSCAPGPVVGCVRIDADHSAGLRRVPVDHDTVGRGVQWRAGPPGTVRRDHRLFFSCIHDRGPHLRCDRLEG